MATASDNPTPYTEALRAAMAKWRALAERDKRTNLRKYDTAHTAYTRCADELEAALRTYGEAVLGEGWRPVSEIPPHDPKPGSLGAEYLVFPRIPGRPNAYYGRRVKDRGCWYFAGSEVIGITHWMPLPSPPEPAK